MLSMETASGEMFDCMTEKNEADLNACDNYHEQPSGKSYKCSEPSTQRSSYCQNPTTVNGFQCEEVEEDCTGDDAFEYTSLANCQSNTSPITLTTGCSDENPGLVIFISANASGNGDDPDCDGGWGPF